MNNLSPVAKEIKSFAEGCEKPSHRTLAGLFKKYRDEQARLNPRKGPHAVQEEFGGFFGKTFAWAYSYYMLNRLTPGLLARLDAEENRIPVATAVKLARNSIEIQEQLLAQVKARNGTSGDLLKIVDALNPPKRRGPRKGSTPQETIKAKEVAVEPLQEEVAAASSQETEIAAPNVKNPEENWWRRRPDPIKPPLTWSGKGDVHVHRAKERY